MIAVITYDHPHRKTQDLVSSLIIAGYSDLMLIALPWKERKSHNALYEHRPTCNNSIKPDLLSMRFGLKYAALKLEELSEFFSKNLFSRILIGGAGILPKDVCESYQIINSHPGYLPFCRGLDAYKWAIYSGLPIGATTHIISDIPDEGQLIESKIVPVYFEDTYHSVANRVYEMEISMLVDAINKPIGQPLDSGTNEVGKRMPKNKEVIMMHRFEELRKKSPSRL